MRDWKQIIVVEDNAARAERRRLPGVTTFKTGRRVRVCVHRVSAADVVLLAEASYKPGNGKGKNKRKAALALKLIDRVRQRLRQPVVVAGPAYGSNRFFVDGILERGLDLVAMARPSSRVRVKLENSSGRKRLSSIARLLGDAEWENMRISPVGMARNLPYAAASFGKVKYATDRVGELVVAQAGGISGPQPGTLAFIRYSKHGPLRDAVKAASWSRWIRVAVRMQEKARRLPPRSLHRKGDFKTNGSLHIKARASISIGRRQDDGRSSRDRMSADGTQVRGHLASQARPINVIDLFAGAGGLGLGFAMARTRGFRYRLLFSGECHPIYVNTLDRNHRALARILRSEMGEYVPEETRSVDLRDKAVLKAIRRYARSAGGLDVVVGGPPCQGFSNANRNSWSASNPHNQHVFLFLDYLSELRPPVFVMENVQGIFWTARNGDRYSVLERITRMMEGLGYLVFPKILDAVWYGAPQFRSRFFVLGIRGDLRYKANDFGEWGPFPTPTHGPGRQHDYVTVKDSIADLPRIGNGSSRQEMPYTEPNKARLSSNEFLRLVRLGAPRDVILDHLTTRHAPYVIDRYRRIPEGGNWEDIVHMLGNYHNVSRTHSNIYRRLLWDEPAVTIGHYRKSMLVHPTQHRGLSLREASRLQTFPDWFRFSGTADGGDGGLVHKQQQLANAVCPIVARALAEFIGRL